MTRKSSQIWFFVLALLALGLYYLMFEFRYFWFIEPEQAVLMRSVFAASVAVIVLLWAAYPSILVVVAVTALGLFAPHLMFDADARPLLGREIDLPTIGISAIPVALMAIATYLRKRSKTLDQA